MGQKYFCFFLMTPIGVGEELGISREVKKLVERELISRPDYQSEITLAGEIANGLELQSLLIFTTATAEDREMEELRGKWSNLASFKSAYSSLVNAGFDQENFWTILLSRGEPDALFHDIEKAIQADDRTKVIVGRPNGIIDRIFLSPFCWRRGATEQMAFVMCNGKLEFAIDERGWEIDEKVEMNGGGGIKNIELVEMQRRSVWIDLLPGVRMATASPLQKQKAEDEQQKMSRNKRIGKKRAKNGKNEENEKKVEELEKGDEENERGEGNGENDEREQMDEDANKEANKKENEENNINKEKEEEEDEDPAKLDGNEQKRQCRYRLSCYAKKGIALSEKQRERQQILLAGRPGPPKGEKNTMKDAADAAVKKMKAKEKEGKMLREKYEKDGDKVLANFWSELERKNRCKYRKSCYETGRVPEIEQSPMLKWLGERKEGKEEEIKEELAVKKFDEMDEYERKMHCQYRKSCLKNGIRSNIENELEFLRVDLGNAVKAMKKWWWELEKKKTEKKEREKLEGHEGEKKPFTKLECKYRKSCYVNGELPEHLQRPKGEKDPDEHAVKVLGGKKVPTSVKELKLFCKYRKSCYVASAEAKNEDGKIEKKMEQIGKGPQNETILEINVEEKPRKAKPNSDLHPNSVEIVIQNGGEKEGKIEKELDEEEEKEEKKNGENEVEKTPVHMAARLRRRRKTANTKPKIGVDIKIKKAEKKMDELKPKPRERKQKRYKIVDVMPMDEPVMIEEIEANKSGEKGEEKEGEKEQEEEEEKQKGRKNKKYIQEDVKKEEMEERKIWAKREMKLSKLECRYRKSCYKSGIIPEWAAKRKEIGLWALIQNIFEGKKRNEMDDILGWRGMSEKERWFRCKYRKSCYERMIKRAGTEKGPLELEGKRKKVEPIKKKSMEKMILSASPKTVDMTTKLQCKYRKSCYDGGNVPRVMERIIDSVEGGQRNWTGEGRCNPWRISCRQAMGLPIKEKAPMGPNGKRLCRKKKSPLVEGNQNKK